jgi:hypothetical protein
MNYEDIFRVIIKNYSFEDHDSTYIILSNSISQLPYLFRKLYIKANSYGIINQKMKNDLLDHALDIEEQKILDFLKNIYLSIVDIP